MKDYDSIAKNLLEHCPDPAKAYVLEIGSDARGGMLQSLAPLVRKVVGINIIGNPSIDAPNASFCLGDIRHTDFADNSFDLAVSYAVFEHVRGIEEALEEIHRVLKPGGVFITTFGPVWSCMWGHHLWVRKPERHVYNQPPHLPPYCHLLMEPEDLRAELEGKHAAEVADEIVKFVYQSDEQNQVPHDAYVKMAKASKLEIVALRSHRNTKLEKAYLAGHDPLESYLERLEKKLGPGDYLSASLSLRLRKPG